MGSFLKRSGALIDASKSEADELTLSVLHDLRASILN